MSRSRTRTLVETLAPASRHTLAAALSTEKPRLPKTPVAKDAERTATPAGARREGKRESEAEEEKKRKRGEKGNGKRRRRDRRERQSRHGARLRLQERLVRGSETGPATVQPKRCSTAWAVRNCQPWTGTPWYSTSIEGWRGRIPWRRFCQEGLWKPWEARVVRLVTAP